MLDNVEILREALAEAREERRGEEAWSEEKRLLWIGYLTGLRESDLVSVEEVIRLLKEELGVTAEELEYTAYLLEGTIDLIPKEAREGRAGSPVAA